MNPKETTIGHTPNAPAFPTFTSDALTELRATVARLEAEKAATKAEAEKWRGLVYAPTGDNHHNALLCPYCNPEGRKFEAAAPADPMADTSAWLIFFEDKGAEQELFVGPGAAVGARERFDVLKKSWSVRLFQCVDRG